MKSEQVNKQLTFQVRVEKGWWRILSQLRTDEKRSFKELVEDALVNTYMIENGKVRRVSK